MSPRPSSGLDFVATPRFEIVRHIGSGGMGSVYEAVDCELDARVALKRLDRVEPERLIRFKREFRDFQNLSHPNLVALRELFSDGAEWFFSMELLDGVDFLEYVRPSVEVDSIQSSNKSLTATALSTSDEPLPPPPPQPPPPPPRRFVRGPLDEARLRLALPQLAIGIQALHDAGKLHCDIKPSNVLVTRDGRVVLVDYGVAVDLHEGPRARGLTGTVAYMAPEQAACGATGRAADWYAVGVVLYEALTGRRPHEGTTRQILDAKRSVGARSPRDIEPTAPPDLSELCEDLLEVDPTARPSGADVLTRLGVGAISPRRRSRPTGFIGRIAQLSALDGAYQQSRERATLVVVYGESGVGKSALVRHFIEELERSDSRAVALNGACYERESVPYKAFDGVIDALSHRLESLPAADVKRLLPEHVSLVAHAFPVLWGSRAIRAAAANETPRSIDPREQRSQLFGALRDLFRRMSEAAPLVVAIDDVQWADADSRALLTDLLVEPGAPRVLLVATVRTENADRESLESSELGDLVRGAIPIPVERLLPDEARVLAERLVRDSASSRELDPEVIARVADGHPLFLDALVRHASVVSDSSARTSLEEALWARIAPLPSPARRVLELVAVASGRIAQEAVADAAGLALAELVDHVAAMRTSHLLATFGSGPRDLVAPYHDQIRRAVLAHVDPPAQRDHHRRLAEALEATHHIDPEALTVHWRECGEPAKAATFAKLAAEKAMSALAFDRAANFYAQCIALPGLSAPRELIVRHAEALANAGKGSEAGHAFLMAAKRAPRWEALELQRRAADQLLRVGQFDEALELYRTVREAIGMPLAETPRRALAGLIQSRVRLRLRGLRWRETEPGNVPANVLLRVDTGFAMALALSTVDTIRGSDVQTRSLMAALETGDPYRISRALALEAAFNAASTGTRGRARTERLVNMAEQIAERIDNPHALGLASWSAGASAYLEGRFSTAHRLCERAVETYRNRCIGVAWETASAETMSLWALHYLGRLDEIDRRMPGLLKSAYARGDLYDATNLRTSHTNTRWLAADRPDVARLEIADAMREWSPKSVHLPHYYELHALTQNDLYIGDGAAAWARVERGWASMKSALLLRLQCVRIEMHFLRARAALATNRIDQARADARRLDRERAPWASALATLVRACADANDGNETSERFEAAANALDALDMRLHAACARSRAGASDADAWLTEHGVRAPERMTRMVAPISREGW